MWKGVTVGSVSITPWFPFYLKFVWTVSTEGGNTNLTDGRSTDGTGGRVREVSLGSSDWRKTPVYNKILVRYVDGTLSDPLERTFIGRVGASRGFSNFDESVLLKGTLLSERPQEVREWKSSFILSRRFRGLTKAGRTTTTTGRSWTPKKPSLPPTNSTPGEEVKIRRPWLSESVLTSFISLFHEIIVNKKCSDLRTESGVRRNSTSSRELERILTHPLMGQTSLLLRTQ